MFGRAAKKRIAELEAEVRALRKLVADLQEKLNKNSGNSSQPPSSDKPWNRPERKTAGAEKRGSSNGRSDGGKRKRGGQPGHPGAQRALVPAEQVDSREDYFPCSCENCGRGLPRREGDAAPRRHQVARLPEIKLKIEEHCCHGVECDDCGHVTYALLPETVPPSGFCAQLTALVALCTGDLHLSKRSVQRFLGTVFKLTVSLGLIAKMEQRVSQALAGPVEEARQHVTKQKELYQDESSWKEGPKGDRKAWLWIARTRFVTVFKIARSRSAEVAKKMLKGFVGVLVTDRYAAYSFYETLLRQLCWSHLLRDFQAFAERKGRSAEIGRELLELGRQMFKWWHKVRDGTMSRATFRRHMLPLEDRVGSLLREAQHCRNARTRATATEILKLEAAMWTFVDIEGVEPTNNFGEQGIRPGVMWRRVSFGTNSARGSRYVERMLSTTTTLRQQGRGVYEYLCDVIRASFDGTKPPSLLPSTV
jgi:transposase